ncbi:MAG TPA: DegT/DnrJ/EryC1/StrS aminotransferase family protein [Pedococcus sp.]|nr:DegT/DnrJ/EryC1/StrS aminotransferase family protein [Pedococcus sp.]
MTVQTPPLRAPDTSGRQIPFARTVIGPEARAAVERVLQSGWVTTGQEVVHFERELADYVGAARGVAVSSCTAGIELALRALGLPVGSRVLMTTDTFCGAAGAIAHAGLVPVLTDVDPRSALPTEDNIRNAVREVGGVSAMVVVHLAGHPVDVEAAAAAAGLGLDHVIEDAAHALGTEVGSRPVGSISRATCFSFYATKNLAIGEGGMVTTDDDDFADTLVSTRLHGMSRDAWRRYVPGAGWRYDVAVDGLKANLTDVQAAIGRAQLRRFAADQARRVEVAARYDAQLVGLESISLPPRPMTGRHAWHLYAVRIGAQFPVPRDKLIDRLTALGIGSSVHFIPLHQLTWHVNHCVVPSRGLPGADEVFAGTLSLPFDQNLTDDDVDEVCGALWQIGQGR